MGLTFRLSRFDGPTRSASLPRAAGEAAFIHAAGVAFPVELLETDDPEVVPWRPSDFAAARAFIENSPEIQPGNRPRLLGLLALLEADPELWIEAGY